MRRLLALTIALIGATVGITAAVASDRGDDRQALSSKASAEPSGPASFAVFRRARESSDAVPERLVTALPNDLSGMSDLQFQDSRLAATDGRDRVYLIPKGRRDVCMLGVFADDTTSMACAPWRSAADARTPLVATSSRESGLRTFGVIADDMSDTRIRRSNGVERVQPAPAARAAAASEPVSAFIDVSQEPTEELVWSTPSGTETMGFDDAP